MLERIRSLILSITAAAAALSGQTYTSLASFNGTNGYFPTAGLVQGIDGNFYGATSVGGAYDDSCGTVFGVTPGGQLSDIFSFQTPPGSCDLLYGPAGLTLGTGGNLYGVTAYEGAYERGSVFETDISGALTTLYSFCEEPACPDGANPEGALVQATNGAFYGTTLNGGAYGYGTVFRITPQGALDTLYSFTGGADGANPCSALVQGRSGDLYGTTNCVGVGGNGHGRGTIFKITLAGSLTTLYTSDNIDDGSDPVAGLVEATNGDFYGTTVYGGASQAGTVFRITPGGTFTTLFDFCKGSGCKTGYQRFGGLVQATDGNLYGTTRQGGHLTNCESSFGSTCGTIYKITPNGNLTTLYRFTAEGGANPWGSMIQGTDGSLYGTTANGGSSSACDYGCGAVFRFTLGLAPFVKTVPTSGPVDKPLIVLGQGLTSASAVTFGKVQAIFTVVSDTEITTSVPTGATTGTVQVVTPGGTLASNVPFRVLP